MAGLLGDVLPYVYSRGNALRRGLLDFAQNPVESFQQTAGLLQDKHREQTNLLAQAFADQREPFKVTDKAAMTQAAGNMLTGLLGFAPVGMTKNPLNPPAGKAPQQGEKLGADYMIDHRPMTVDQGAALLHDLEPAFGKDIYGPNALQFFGSGDARERAILKQIMSVRGKPDAPVTIYRGVPDGVSAIQRGDWVTLDPRVAADYGRVLSLKVPASHVTGWADSLMEHGYYPPK